MRFDRWTNPSLPQTLQIAIFLLYASGVFGLLFGSVLFALGPLLGFLGLVAFVLAGLGVANEYRWAYNLAIGISAAAIIVPLALAGIDVVFSGYVITLLFDVALFALLLHPQSREHQRIWFH
jgi:hypothetical protein